MKYSIKPESPLSHILIIELELQITQNSMIDFKLPIWRPGRYEAANYSKNIQKIAFEDEDGNVLSYQKKNASTWSISAPKGKVKARYRYFAYQMDAGNSFYNEDQLYINFVNCILYSEQHLEEECIVTIELPSDYKLACGLNKRGDNLIAENYHDLADSPLIASTTLQCWNYDVNGLPFAIWFQGNHNLEKDKVVSDFKKFSEYQVNVMGDFPRKEYHFLNQITSYKHYHGVEHGNSTVICIGPGNELAKPNLYSEFAGVSSHELFHAWNILKIRPKEMMPYDFGKPPVFPTGFVAEGFTTYYGDLFLVQSGVFDYEWYFNELNTLFQRHFHNGGRLNNSVVDSSLDLWVDGYQVGAPNKKSSIYVEGAMVALTLDLMIRTKFSSEKSLNNVMRVLWNDYAKKNIGYSIDDIQKISEDVYEESLEQYFQDYVYGVKDKTTLISDLLKELGCELSVKPNQNFLEGCLGLKTTEQDGALVVMSIEEKSLGEQFFSFKDKIKKINNENVSKESIKELKPGTYKFLVERQNEEIEFEINATDSSYLKVRKIEKLKNPSAKQKDLFENWLNLS
ncbi:M61 family metallopeptidase [Fulvivirga lutea]|uniref:M61 family metallopeptidase n=1 Tax=Fulvivirga lutea TaxID=2810512 RepID=A0A975A1L3_9BACT|nr:M61 family metallopeptidase [Fulvivirga lutea]QSE97946.1 M61 family metallopeptidase [Fulvivirga lutea]